MSANSVAANGAGPIPAISMMRNPARGPIMVTFPLRLHAIAAPETLVAASAERGVSQQHHACMPDTGVNKKRACVKRVSTPRPARSPANLAASRGRCPLGGGSHLRRACAPTPEFERFIHIAEHGLGS